MSHVWRRPSPPSSEEARTTSMLQNPFRAGPSNVRGRTVGLYAFLAVANAAAWIWAFTLFREQPILLGTALIAYGFGLRHAVDPDHIAAIDNVTRKLMQDGQRPVAVGFWFAVGHSVVVALGAGVIALASAAMQGGFQEFRHVGGIVSTCVSALFLFVIAGINLVVLRAVHRSFGRVRRLLLCPGL